MSASYTVRLWTALLLGLAVFSSNAEAKPPSGVDVNVQVGYDGYVQMGRVNPVIVDLKNSSSGKNISGELVLKYNGVDYVTKLDLPSPSNKRFFLYFPCDNYAPYLTLQVRSKQWTESFDINQFFKSCKPSDTTILVLSNHSGSLGVLNQLSTVSMYRNLYENANAQIGSSKTFVGYFRPEEVDANPKFFARADVIVLADIDYQQISAKLAEALKASVSGGTGIVFSLGLNGSKVAASRLADLCPLKVQGTQQLSDLGSFGQRYRINAKAASATYAVGVLAPGAQAIAMSGQIPAVVRSYWGSGAVTALAFDYTMRPFKQNAQLASLFMDTALSVPEGIEVRNWFVHPEPITKILGRLEEADPMPPHFVLLFLLAYVVLIGPINFLLLRQMRRQTLVWTTIPLIILGFSYAGMETGRLTRGADNVTSVFQEMHIYPNAPYIPYQTVMMVFTAERAKYDLTVPDESAFLYADIPQQVDQYQFRGGPNPAQFRGLTGSKLDNSGMPEVQTTQGKWTSKDYFYQGYASHPFRAESHLSARRVERGATDIQGTFVLELPFELRDCYLFSGSNPVQVGDLAGQGEYSMDALPKDFRRDTAGAQEANYLFAARNELADLSRGASATGLAYRDEVQLVGFTDKIEGLAKFKRAHKSYTLTMVVVHLPYRQRFEPNAPGSTRTLVTGGGGFTIDSRWGYYNEGGQQYVFEPNGFLDLVVQTLGQASNDTRLQINLTALVDRNTEVKHPGDYVTAYAWTNGGWQEVKTRPELNSFDFSLAGLRDSTGTIRLRLVSKVDGLKLSEPRAEAYGI